MRLSSSQKRSSARSRKRRSELNRDRSLYLFVRRTPPKRTRSNRKQENL